MLNNYISRDRKIFIKFTCRYAFLLFIVLNIPYLLALGLELPSYLHSRQSSCGFMDAVPCSFGASVGNNFIIISIILGMIPAMICVAIWGGAVGKYCRFKFRKRGTKYSIYNILPCEGASIGVVIGFFAWLGYTLSLSLIIR
jgi:hypothetical protein